MTAFTRCRTALATLTAAFALTLGACDADYAEELGVTEEELDRMDADEIDALEAELDEDAIEDEDAPRDQGMDALTEDDEPVMMSDAECFAEYCLQTDHPPYSGQCLPGQEQVVPDWCVMLNTGMPGCGHLYGQAMPCSEVQ